MPSQEWDVITPDYYEAHGYRVWAPTQVLQQVGKDRCAVRIPALGLTAYGTTPAEAASHLRGMFTADVKAHIDIGSVEGWLERSGVKWERV